MLYYAGRAGLMGSLLLTNTTGSTDVDAMQCLAYGALISAVDPVATLSVLGSDEVGAHAHRRR